MNILTSPDTPVFSLDIETTSLDHANSKVWSVGAVGDNFEKEFFQRDVLKTKNPTNIIQELVDLHTVGGAGHFGEKQASNGAFSAYETALKSKSLVSMNKTFTEITENLKKNAGVFLVQNLPFESEAFSKATDKTGGQKLSRNISSKFISEVFGVDVAEQNKSKGWLPQDNRILEARKNFRNASDLFKISSDFSQETINNFRGQLDKTSNALFETINTVVGENKKAGFSTAVDLMDISRIYSSKLALGGGLEAGYLHTGLSVDYLAKNLLGVTEKHTALSDAKQQREIFSILTNRIDDINKNGLSEFDKTFGKELMESDVHDRTFVKGIENHLTEALNKNKTVKEKDLSKLLARSLSNYNTIPEKANFNRLAFAEEIRTKFLKDPSEAFTRLSEVKDSALLPDIKALAAPNESPILNAHKTSKSKVLLGMTALGAVAMVGSNNRQSKKEDMTSYDDLYENVYLGEQYANWQERNNSHKMIY